MNRNKKQNKNISQNTSNQVKISWQAPENIPYERGLLWKISIATIVLIVIVLGILNQAWTFSLAIATFVLTYYLVHFSPPKMLTIQISTLGITIGKINYSYQSIDSFWLIQQGNFKILCIRLKGKVLNDIKIQLLDQDPIFIQKFLQKHLKQLPIEQASLTESILSILKI